jgi:hypothetical protein
MRINASIRGDRSNDRKRGALFETLNPSTTEATGRDIVLNPCSAAAASIGVLDIFGFEVRQFKQLFFQILSSLYVKLSNARVNLLLWGSNKIIWPYNFSGFWR